MTTNGASADSEAGVRVGDHRQESYEAAQSMPPRRLSRGSFHVIFDTTQVQTNLLLGCVDVGTTKFEWRIEYGSTSVYHTFARVLHAIDHKPKAYNKEESMAYGNETWTVSRFILQAIKVVAILQIRS